MIKFVQCMRRHPDLSPAEFRQQWEDYKPTWEAFAAMMSAVRVSFSTTLAIEANEQLSLNRGTEEPYDGVVESMAGAASLEVALKVEAGLGPNWDEAH